MKLFHAPPPRPAPSCLIMLPATGRRHRILLVVVGLVELGPGEAMDPERGNPGEIFAGVNPQVGSPWDKGAACHGAEAVPNVNPTRQPI